VFNLRSSAPAVLHVQVENLHPRSGKVAAVSEVAAGF
jgi:hypothetical protein